MQAVCAEAFCYPLDLEGLDDNEEEDEQNNSSLGLSNLDSSALKAHPPGEKCSCDAWQFSGQLLRTVLALSVQAIYEVQV